jgi:uncharacterized protein (UPF0248 family)
MMKKENPLHKLLTTLRAKGKEFYLTYENRPDNVTLTNEDIAQILKGSFLLEDGETQIPFHRIIQISGKVVNGYELFYLRRKEIT